MKALSLAEEFQALILEIREATDCTPAQARHEATTTLYDLLGYYDDPRPLNIDNRAPAPVLRALETWREEVLAW